jgi:polyferredoxin
VTSLLQPNERVLSTMNADGSRRWLAPRVVEGVLYQRRRIMGWLLIAIFVSLPHIHWGGKQLFFLDIAGGEFTLFGQTFLRTDTLLLALFGMSLFVTIFLLTALFGRVWCGWACPQTVYLEFVFRPLERLFGSKAYGAPKKGPLAGVPATVRVPLRWIVVGLVCFMLANTFLSYFVGSRTLLSWITQPPWVHPLGFLFVMFVTAAMVFDFVFFREQLCIVACPYGRFQSVLLDKHSLIVGYDTKRGEPRGKAKHAKRGKTLPAKPDLHLRVVEAPAQSPAAAPADPADAITAGLTQSAAVDPDARGDCVDCLKCVACCPTGIDIRDGLQLECIHCAQCIDACDSVMTKLKRPTGLIRYSTQNELETGARRFIRPRVILYPLVLCLLLTAMTVLIVTQSPAGVSLLRGQGQPFNRLDSGQITNQARLVITNRTDSDRAYMLSSDRLEISGLDLPVLVPAGETVNAPVLLVAEPEVFLGQRGRTTVKVTVSDGEGFETTIHHQMLGPAMISPRVPPAQPDSQSDTQPETPVGTPSDRDSDAVPTTSGDAP